MQKVFFLICIFKSWNITDKSSGGGDYFRPMCGLNDKFRNIENDIYMPLMQSTVEFYSQISKVIILQMPLPEPQKSDFTLWSQLRSLRFSYFFQLK